MAGTTNFNTESGYPLLSPGLLFVGSRFAQMNPELFSTHVGSEPSAPPADLADKQVTDEPSAKQADVEKFAGIIFVDKDNPKLTTGINNADEIDKKFEAPGIERVKNKYNEKVKSMGRMLDLPIVAATWLTAISLFAIALFAVPAFALGLLAGGLVITCGAVATLAVSLTAIFALINLKNVKKTSLEKKRDSMVALMNRVVGKIASDEKFKAGLQKRLDSANDFHARRPYVQMNQVIEIHKI